MATADCSNRTRYEDATIRRALRILENRLREPGAQLRGPDAVRDYLTLMLGDREHEVFAAVFLDVQYRVIASEELFRGTLTQATVYPREVVKRALALNAAAVILAHNHPSGVEEPSQDDRWLTDQLRAALAMVDVRTLDHFVIAGTRYTSFLEQGWLTAGPPESTPEPAKPRRRQTRKPAKTQG